MGYSNGEVILNDVVFFNELSLDVDIPVDFGFIKELADLIGVLRGIGIYTCRIYENIKYQLRDFLESANGLNQVDFNSWFYSFFHGPYDEDFEDEILVKFLEHEFKYEDKDVLGLAYAYLNETASLSLSLNSSFKSSYICIKDKIGNMFFVPNISQLPDISVVKSWFDNHKEPELIPCNILPKDKQFKFTPHHGTKELTQLWNRLRMSDYVVECINSIDYQPHDHTFIHECYDDGIIEVVMYWLPTHYAMSIKTTGRTLRETERIAQILQEKYGK